MTSFSGKLWGLKITSVQPIRKAIYKRKEWCNGQTQTNYLEDMGLLALRQELQSLLDRVLLLLTNLEIKCTSVFC